MSKYQPLKDYLIKSNGNSISMTFSEIEKILGFKLPVSSHKYRAWWSNNASNNVMTEAWINAGFITEEVDLAGEKLKFSRANDNSSSKSKNINIEKPTFASIFGALKGQMVILPDVDLTEPLLEFEDDGITY